MNNYCDCTEQKERIGVCAAIEDLENITQNLLGVVCALDQRLLPIRRLVVMAELPNPVRAVTDDSEIVAELKSIANKLVSIANSVTYICNAVDL